MDSPLSPEQWEALATDRHLAVVANAGSGKTRVLTYRYLWLLIEHHVEIDAIVAITFTTKAAAEMRERVRELIQEMLEKPDLRAAMHFSKSDNDVTERLKHVRRQLGDARISTFHSFCAGLLRQFGHVVEIDPESVELSERDAATMRERALRLAMHQYMRDRRSEILDVYESLDFTSFENAVGSLARSAERFHLLEEKHGASESIQDQCSRAARTSLLILGRSVVRLLSDISSQIADLGATSDPATQEFLQSIDDVNSQLGDPDQIDQDSFKTAHAVLLKLFTTKGTARKKDFFPGSSQMRPIKEKHLVMVSALGTQDMAEPDLAQATVAWHAAHVAEMAHEAYTRDKRERNAIDFDDMMSGVVRLLEDHPPIAGYVSGTIAHLMVDEYQDTNPTQYRLMQLLVPQLVDPSRGTGPRVFVVGDDKQSIYGFRDADVRLFRRTVYDLQQINEQDGASIETTLLTLATSYRMASPLADATNDLCTTFFREDSEYDVPYTPLVCGRSSEHDGHVGSLQTLITDHDDAEDADLTAVEREARTVARQIVDMLQQQSVRVYDEKLESVRPVHPGDIAVLARRIKSVTAVASELHQAHVPFQVHGGRAFFSRPEVADLRNLLTAAVDPHDALALASVLRSPIFRCSDADLTRIALGSEDGGLGWESLRAMAEMESASAPMQVAVDLLTQCRERLRHEPPTNVVRDVLTATDWYGTIFEHPRCAQIQANVEKTLEIIRSAAETPGATLRDVLDAIALPDQEDREAESTYDPDPNAVQVMTIHAAKGLEFPVVILCDLAGRRGHASYVLTDRLGLTVALGSWTMDVDSEKPVSVPKGLIAQANAIIDEERELAEARRLLYVALTRGKDHVYVSFMRRYNQPNKDTGEVQLRKPEGAMATLLQPIILEEERLPIVERPSDDGVYEPERGPFQYHDRTESVAWDPQPAALSVTQLLEDLGHGRADGDTDTAAAIGTIVHDTLETALREGLEHSLDELKDLARHHPLSTTDRLTDAVTHLERIRASPIWPTLTDVSTERSLGSMLDRTLLYGRIDALRITKDSAEVWDWKTNAIPSGGAAELAEHYRIQMQAYAWILMSSHTVEFVTTRLVFTGLLEDDPKGAVVEQTYDRNDIEDLASVLNARRRMVVSA